MPARNDYQQLFDEGGAQALNEAIRQRNPDRDDLARELLRMERMGFWRIRWDSETGVGEVVGRSTARTPSF